MLSKAKDECTKSRENGVREDVSAMILIDFDLLRITKVPGINS